MNVNREQSANNDLYVFLYFANYSLSPGSALNGCEL